MGGKYDCRPCRTLSALIADLSERRAVTLANNALVADAYRTAGPAGDPNRTTLQRWDGLRQRCVNTLTPTPKASPFPTGDAVHITVHLRQSNIAAALVLGGVRSPAPQAADP